MPIEELDRSRRRRARLMASVSSTEQFTNLVPAEDALSQARRIVEITERLYRQAPTNDIANLYLRNFRYTSYLLYSITFFLVFYSLAHSLYLNSQQQNFDTTFFLNSMQSAYALSQTFILITYPLLELLIFSVSYIFDLIHREETLLSQSSPDLISFLAANSSSISNEKKIAHLNLNKTVLAILHNKLDEYSFICAISFDIRTKTVSIKGAAEGKQFYEYAELLKQIVHNGKDPITSKLITTADIQPEPEMQARIDQFVEIFLQLVKTEKFKQLALVTDDTVADSSKSTAMLEYLIASIIDNKIDVLLRPEINISSEITELRTEGTRQRLMITWPESMGYAASAAPPILQNVGNDRMTASRNTPFGI